MKKLTTLFMSLTIGVLIFSGCKKKHDDNPAPVKTKTDHITASSWKFDKAMAGATNVTGFVPACWLDNSAVFAAAGTGTISEGANVCGTSSAGPFTWSFQTNETILVMSAPVIPTGSGTFTIVTLDETSMVLSQVVTLPPAGAQTVTFYFKH
jgi:hypothetical protein